MTGPGRHALVVVTSRYEDVGLGALRAPVQDAAGLADVLGDPTVGDFDVEVLTDPTVQRLRIAVEDFFADRSTRDTLLLHFSCHGVKNAAGKLFLAAADTYRNRLAATAVPAEYVSGLMLESRAQRAVLLLDCCYAGAFERGMIARAGATVEVQESFHDLERTGGKRGRAVFTASSALEYAFEGDQPVPGGEPGTAPGDGPSLFTGALVEGLRSGDADLDHDGEVGMSELADYVNERIRELTPHQTPQLWLFGSQGDLTIAHTGRRRAVATDLPTPLADAVRSDSRERKLWSVEDLGTLLCGPDVGVALAAHIALSELAADDSRRVAERATRALALAAPRVDTPALRVAAAEPAVVKVAGPPIVLATLEARTDPWLKVRYVDGGIELVPEETERGHHEGTVQLRTATGELAIAVATPEEAEATGEAAVAAQTGSGGPAVRQQDTVQQEPEQREQERREPEREPEQQEREQREPEQVTPLMAAGTEAAAAAPPLSPWPFLFSAAAMLAALSLPFYEKVEAKRYPMWLSSPYWYWPLGWVGTSMLVLAILSTITCSTAGVLVLRRSAVVRRRAVRVWCGTLATLTVYAMVALWVFASVLRKDFDAGLGFLAFVMGGLLQAWGAVQLRLAAVPRPPDRTDPHSLRPCTLAAVFTSLTLAIPLGSGGPAWQLIALLEWSGARQAASAVILLSAVVNAAMAVHAWDGHSVARLRGVLWWYGTLALLTLGATVYFWSVLKGQAGLGQYLLTLGCGLQLWTAVTLWLDKPATA
ncbi:hypothetical protein DEJ50_11780 [Streptomyces venezuelae]|uniref:Peptidase C14 caspase domain-containing protein n=1 Tax=Streptomyces venezuelae TaxID=54571 RepID=A0A5P2CZS4_STRVZ|nr:caspase family protein [Streptomyces venezuelae]QES48402.1 hypothetical protein DEJ50_11780 [Streptomyces venezuelae]